MIFVLKLLNNMHAFDHLQYHMTCGCNMLWSFLHISAKLPNQLTNTSIVLLSGCWDILESLDENPSLCSECRNAESCGRLFSFMGCFGLIVRVTLSKMYSKLGLVLFCVSMRRDSSLPLEVSSHSLEGFLFFPIMVPLHWLFLLLFLLSRDSALCALLGFCIIALPFITFVSFTSSKSLPSVCGMDFLCNRMDQLETIALCDYTNEFHFPYTFQVQVWILYSPTHPCPRYVSNQK